MLRIFFLIWKVCGKINSEINLPYQIPRRSSKHTLALLTLLAGGPKQAGYTQPPFTNTWNISTNISLWVFTLTESQNYIFHHTSQKEIPPASFNFISTSEWHHPLCKDQSNPRFFFFFFAPFKPDPKCRQQNRQASPWLLVWLTRSDSCAMTSGISCCSCK